MATKKLSDREILRCIQKHSKPTRTGPTQAELADLLGVSLAGVQTYLKALLAAGEVQRSSIRGYIIPEDR